MDNFWFGFVKLSQWSLEFLWTAPFSFVTAALILNIVASVLWTLKRGRVFMSVRLLILFLPLAAFPIIASAGSIAWAAGVPASSGEGMTPHAIAGWSVDLANLVAVVLGLILLVRLKAGIWLPVSILLFIEWMLLGVSINASMPIGGVWL